MLPSRRRIIVWTAVLITCVYGIQYWLNHKSYIFDHKNIAAISRKHVIKSSEAVSEESVRKAFSLVLQDLRSKYRGHILPDSDLQWIFINAGGWMGSMCLLHASVTEYVLFFGTALGSAGHSGRYWANITDTILTGTYHQWSEGRLTHKTYKAGDTVYHNMGDVTAMQWSQSLWMVEYGRGFIPSTLPFALADSVFSTTDIYNVYSVLRVYAKALLMEVGFSLSSLRQFVKDSL